MHWLLSRAHFSPFAVYICSVNIWLIKILDIELPLRFKVTPQKGKNYFCFRHQVAQHIYLINEFINSFVYLSFEKQEQLIHLIILLLLL